jgi:hypothetical protein
MQSCAEYALSYPARRGKYADSAPSTPDILIKDVQVPPTNTTLQAVPFTSADLSSRLLETPELPLIDVKATIELKALNQDEAQVKP